MQLHTALRPVPSPGVSSIGATRPHAEYGVAIAIVIVIQLFTWATQPRIGVSNGRGYDGAIYYDVAQQLADGERPEGRTRFVRRVGTPWLATLFGADDLLDGFQTANVVAALVASVLLLMWLRRYLAPGWLRLLLVAVYATHWLQVVRFTFFYPAIVDPWSEVACFAGLNALAWYEAKPGLRPAATLAIISAAGVLFREIVVLVPLALLFARNPRVEHLSRPPFVRVPGFPRLGQWIPLALSCAALAWVTTFIVATDADASAYEHVVEGAFTRNALAYLLGWLTAFGPLLFIVLFDWREALDLLWRHKPMLVYMAGVAALGWAASMESERHALYSASPVLYLLAGRAIQRYRACFRSPALAVFLVATQALVHRVLLPIPQPVSDYLEHDAPELLLTPVGDATSYLHLFPSYMPRDMAVEQLGQFLALGMVILFWIGRRVRLHAAQPRESRPAIATIEAS